MSDKNGQVIIEAFDPKDAKQLLLEVLLVKGRFVWRHKGELVETCGERRAAIDRTLHAYVGHRDFLTLLSILEPLNRWCQRHGTGKEE